MDEPTAKKDETSETAKKGQATRLGGDTSRSQIEQAVQNYVNSLSTEHRMLVVLKAKLYDGSWEPMLDDLRNRMAGKPYIFKLVNRIKDDIERIEQMKKFEAENGIDLAEYVDLE